MGADERVFRAHLDAGPFQSGVDRGRWRFLSLAWPHAVIAVRAAEWPGGPAEYALRFELANYPQTPHTAQPWDPERNAPLEPARWPGGRALPHPTGLQSGLEGRPVSLPAVRPALDRG